MSRKVYVIDDDEAMRDSLSFLLDSANFEVALFETAQQFLDALPNLSIGCIVSDVRMPGIDGIELLKRLKTLRSGYPIVVMTGHGDVPLAVEAMKLGAMDFLEKPFEDERLIAMIETALHLAEPAAEGRRGGAGHCGTGREPEPQGTPGHGRADRRFVQQADRQGI
jgi:two-component system, LuxR family, response regulator FixJ